MYRTIIPPWFINIFIANACFVILYFISKIALKGRTIGKFVTGTKAVNEDGTENAAKNDSYTFFIPYSSV